MTEAERRIRNNRIRRNRQLRQRITFMTVTVCLTLILAVTLGSSFSKAQEEGNIVHYKYFESIMVEPGDTLTSIAHKYSNDQYTSLTEYVNEVVSINHLSDKDEITAGEYLVVPYFSTSLQ